MMTIEIGAEEKNFDFDLQAFPYKETWLSC